MLRLPVIQGVIKRRLLINFRADPDVVQNLLPRGFRPKLHGSHAIVGLCLIRLENIRPLGRLPIIPGMSSENAAHRMAVWWRDSDGIEREGVYVPRRDTDSAWNAIAGGRIFPGEHHFSRFDVQDDGRHVALAMDSGSATISVRGSMADALPESSCFSSLAEASEFFERGCVGYSATGRADHLDGIELQITDWRAAPFAVSEVRSTYFADRSNFPEGSIQFDHGLIMRNILHQWRSVPVYLS